MKRQLKYMCGLTAMVAFVVTGSLSSFAAAPSYQAFRLSVSNGSVPISQGGETFNAKTLLGTIPDATMTPVTDSSTPVWARNANISDVTFKKAALSMALGYSVFLQLTNLPAELKAAGGDEDTVNAIVNGMNVNQWLATAWQESKFNYAEHSGYYQIDNSPADLKQNSQNSQYAFLTKKQGGAALNLKNASSVDAFLNYMDIRGFVWQSVEKGYYEAISYNRNKSGYGDVPIAAKDGGFSYAKWAVTYAKNPANATMYPADCAKMPVAIPPALGFAQTMSLMYNRGQFPCVYPTLSAGKLLVPLFQDSSASIADKIDYKAVKDASADPEIWGQAYVWQLGWVNAALNNSSNTFYSDKISFADVKAMLQTLKGFYGSSSRTTVGDTSVLAFTDVAVDGAIAKAETMGWNVAYNSQAAFDNMAAIAKYLLTNS